MSLVDVLNQIWTNILGVTQIFVMPDWNFLISLLPILVVLGLIGPFFTGLVLVTGVYQITKPRVRVAFEEGPRVAEIGAGGEPGLSRGPALLPPRPARLPVRHDPLRAVS